jgi:hypothetical protein
MIHIIQEITKDMNLVIFCSRIKSYACSYGKQYV